MLKTVSYRAKKGCNAERKFLYIPKLLFCKGVQCDFHFSRKVAMTHLFTGRPSMMKKVTQDVLRYSLRAAGIKDPPHVARFQRHHCRSTAAPVHLSACTAAAGTAIQGTLSTTIMLYVTRVQR